MKNKYFSFILTITFLTFVWSVINPHDYFTWFLEVVPALLAFTILAATYKKFRFTNLVYTLICLHAIILIIGGHYTYAEMPLFNWLRDTFNLDRNYYDRLGHFAQGFIPALIVRELIIRKNLIGGQRWQFFFIIFTILGFSAFYEFFEWWVAIGTGESATAFLGTQGDVWDTQWDMFLCFIGATTSLLFLSKLHDKYLDKIKQAA